MQAIPSVAAMKSERNYGIDLLRIISMLMIIILHILGHGGVLKNTAVLSYRYEAAWFLETASYCAVNCYALISGYVAVKSKFKYSGIVSLWLQVVFYTVLIATVMAIVSPNIGKAEVIDAFFPVSNKIYWYFTAYFCMYFFTPIFNKAIGALSEKQLKAIGVAIFAVFCLIPFLKQSDIFSVIRGYSPIWLMMLYILGGIINKCNLLSKIKPWVLILLYVLMVAITWGERLICDYYNANFSPENQLVTKLTQYTSPTIFFAAIFLFAGFSKLKISGALVKPIALFSSTSFSVYLIHENPYVRVNVIKKIATVFPKLNTPLLVLGVLATAVLIYLICSLIDIIRERLFKALKVKKLVSNMEQKLFKNIW